MTGSVDPINQRADLILFHWGRYVRDGDRLSELGYPSCSSITHANEGGHSTALPEQEPDALALQVDLAIKSLGQMAQYVARDFFVFGLGYHRLCKKRNIARSTAYGYVMLLRGVVLGLSQ